MGKYLLQYLDILFAILRQMASRGRISNQAQPLKKYFYVDFLFHGNYCDVKCMKYIEILISWLPGRATEILSCSLWLSLAFSLSLSLRICSQKSLSYMGPCWTHIGESFHYKTFSYSTLNDGHPRLALVWPSSQTSLPPPSCKCSSSTLSASQWNGTWRRWWCHHW